MTWKRLPILTWISVILKTDQTEQRPRKGDTKRRVEHLAFLLKNMRVLNIASGSAGNATLIGDGSTHILIDAGVSRKRILNGLKQADLSMEDLDAILITHEHTDHISNLGVLLRTREIPVYGTRGTLDGILECPKLGAFDTALLHPVRPDEVFQIHDLKIRPLRTDHDAREPVCYRIEGEHASCAVVTDLGEYNDYLVENLKDLDLLMLEANHDIRMLEAGPYPYPLKMRIRGKLGHLSNEDAGCFLSQLLHDKIRHILLGHISKENNTSDLARLSVETEVDAAKNDYRATDFDIRTLSQYVSSEVFEV